MGFFLKEYFNLPDGYFQEGVGIELAGSGTIYQDGTYGYISTYANADGALIVSDPLPTSDLFNTPFSIQIKYQISSLPDGDVTFPIILAYKSSAPEIGSTGTAIVYTRIYRSGATYYEQWRYYDTADALKHYDSDTSGWTADTSDYVRNTIAVDTEYTITITWHPEKHTFTLTNGTTTKETGETRIPSTEDTYWYLGDNETANYYGSLKLTYIYATDINHRNRFTSVNSLTKAYKKSPILTVLNNLTTQHRDSFTLLNSILDHEPYRLSFTALNNIGVEGQLIYLDGSWQTVSIKGKQLSNRATVEIDGLDVSSKLIDWSIDYDDQTVAKTVSVTVKDRAYAQSIVPRKYSDSDFDTYRIEVKDVDGYSLGQFLIENKSENAAHKSYSCTLTGRSMTALLDIPFSERLQTLYDEATSKSAVVGDLAGEKDIDVQWGIPDSVLPIGALVADDESPLSLIKKIVEAGGGLVYTNREDDLVCAYKDYNTTGNSPVMSLSSGDIVSISQSRTVPSGENQITVEGFMDTSITDGWAQISIESSKDKLKSNGFDSCTITATCRNEDLSIPDVELQTDEEQTPATNDHYEISVSKMIDKDAGGVVSIVKQSDLSLVAGPYEVIDARTIRVGTAMADTTYLVTYYGGETVTFSVDRFADISPTEVLVKNGRAQATLRASSGGGGYAIVSADYLDAQTAQLTVTIADPRVGQVDVSADPSSVSIGETSTVKIQVLDSDGYPADNGLYVDINVIGHGQLIEYAGVVVPTTATTTTESITDGGIENGQYNPIYPVSEIEISTQYQISALTSIYRYENGLPYTDVNYATSATVDGNNITLATPLPSSVTPIQVTYDCTGIATTTFSYPSYRTIPTTSIQNMIVAQCGGEVGSCFITIESPYGSGTGTGGSGAYDRIVRWLTISGKAQPGVNSDGRARFTGGVYCPTGKKAVFNTDQAVAEIWVPSGMGKPTWDVSYIKGTHWTTILGMTVQALQELPTAGSDTTNQDNTGKTYVSGSRIVKNGNTDGVIEHAAYSIAWGEDTETGYTNVNGILTFSKGQPGVTGVVTLTHPDYEDKTASITIPGSITNSNVNDSDTGVTKWSPIQVKVKIPYYWGSI